MTDSLTAWEAVGALARLAPSPHNTQPYRLRPRHGRRGSDGMRAPDIDECAEADIVLVCERLLPDEDPGNAYVLSAFGVFAACLERAALALGYAIAVEPCAEIDGAALRRNGGLLVVGLATLTSRAVSTAEPRPAEASLLSLRRTSRLPYHPREVDKTHRRWFADIAKSAGHGWIELSRREDVDLVLRRNADAVIDSLQSTPEREEMRGWHRLGRTPAHGDGLWEEPMNQPAWMLDAAFRVPRVFAIEPMRTLARRRYLQTQRGTPHIAAICGDFATWSERIAAGRMLFDLWMAMAETDVYMHPFGSLLTNARHARWVAQTLGVRDAWLLLRFGYSETPPAAPRLASIVMA
ncbi:MAG TPA: hypothetical protein VGM90_08460 [Kofleriaceae bacterium]|jgi:hypothetical protein